MTSHGGALCFLSTSYSFVPPICHRLTHTVVRFSYPIINRSPIRPVLITEGSCPLAAFLLLIFGQIVVHTCSTLSLFTQLQSLGMLLSFLQFRVPLIAILIGSGLWKNPWSIYSWAQQYHLSALRHLQCNRCFRSSGTTNSCSLKEWWSLT